MFHKAKILIAGRSKDAVSGLASLLEGQRELVVESRVFGNGHGELWHQNEPPPHVLFLSVGEDWATALPALLSGLPTNRPPLLVACPANDVELLKMAMRAGARDVLTPPYDSEALADRLQELAR